MTVCAAALPNINHRKTHFSPYGTADLASVRDLNDFSIRRY
ncbi:hypothetical protein [Hyphococcus sp.]|jgi:hypothetical protein